MHEFEMKSRSRTAINVEIIGILLFIAGGIMYFAPYGKELFTLVIKLPGGNLDIAPGLVGTIGGLMAVGGEGIRREIQSNNAVAEYEYRKAHGLLDEPEYAARLEKVKNASLRQAKWNLRKYYLKIVFYLLIATVISYFAYKTLTIPAYQTTSIMGFIGAAIVYFIYRFIRLIKNKPALFDD